MTPWLPVLLPIAAALAAASAPRLAKSLAAVALGVTAAVGLWVAATQAAATTEWGPGLELTLAATDFARVMVVLVPMIALPVVLYAAATESYDRVRLFSLLTAFVGAMELLVLAGDLLTLLIGWELVGALSWALIAHDYRDPSNARKAAHAFITTRFCDLGLYVAAGVTFAATGSFAFSRIAEAGPAQLQLIAGGILLAAAAKSAQVPFSPWLFSAMAGPTPVSALLHSSTMVAAGAYALIRLAPHLVAVSWFAPAVVALGLTSALAGGIVALAQGHPKQLLAASTTAQYGLMFAAVGVGSVFAAAAQLVAHAAFKSLLFLTAGTAMHASGSDDLARMRLGRRLPLISAAAAIGAVALAAVPPLGGAWSKEQIAIAAFESSDFLGALVIAAGLLGALYAFRYWLLAYGPGAAAPARIPRQAAASIAALAALSLALSLLWLPAVNDWVGGIGSGRVLQTRPLEFALGVAIVTIAASAAFALDRRSRLAGVPPERVTETAAGWFGIAAASHRVIVAPVLATSLYLAAFDDRVIDAGVRASARIAGGFSGILRRRSELSIDAIVAGIAGGTLRAASGARVADDHGVDRGAEGLAGGIGWAGEWLRRLQTGLSHHYYVIVALGVASLVFILAVSTS